MTLRAVFLMADIKESCELTKCLLGDYFEICSHKHILNNDQNPLLREPQFSHTSFLKLI